MIDKQLTDAKLTWVVFWNLILKTHRIYLFAGSFVAVLFTLQWLFNIDQLLDIVLSNNPLSLGDRADFLVDGFFNIFRFADNLVPISMILIALMQSVTLTLLIGYRSIGELRGKQGASLGLSFLGIGCVACGGSILTPVLGLIATNISISFAESLSNGLLLIALVLSYLSMNKVTFMVARTVHKV